VQEASIAFAADVDIVDIKEPNNGPLGMADLSQIGAILSVSPSSASISIALGELSQLGSSPRPDLVRILANSGRLKYVKIGLAGMTLRADWRTTWSGWLKQLPPFPTPVAVAYADFAKAQAPSPSEIIDAGANCRCRVLLIDTFDKTTGNLFKHLDPFALSRLRERAYAAGMRLALAGSINGQSLPTALSVKPDWIGVRGAVCRDQNRAQEISLLAITELKRCLDPRQPSTASN